MIRVLLDELGECLLVDPADVGREIVERGIPAELLAGNGAALFVGQRLPGVVALEGERRARIAP